MRTETHTTATRLAGEGARVAAWRRERLLGIGFAPGLADGLAHEFRIDLHDLIDLVERGCSPELAVRCASSLHSTWTRPSVPGSSSRDPTRAGTRLIEHESCRAVSTGHDEEGAAPDPAGLRP